MRGEPDSCARAHVADQSFEHHHARAVTDELVRENPKSTLALNVIAPLTRATIELQRGNPAQAIELLRPTLPYEAAPVSSFRLNWIRGQAYLQLKQGAQAAAEFQKIIDHRGWDVTSPLWPLAHLGQARATVLEGQYRKSEADVRRILPVVERRERRSARADRGEEGV